MRSLFACLAALLPLLAFGADADEASLWKALRAGGHVALMRHAIAPGGGDPAGFRLEDCTTQRNLSAQGRAQARAIGARFREQGIAHAALRSSRWCRALETAELLALGPVTPFPGLDSFFTDRGAEAAQTAAIRKLVASHPDDAPPLVLVTHQVNITALSGVYPASGEIVVMRIIGDELALAGRIRSRD